jgi:hypothetical protein
MVWTTPKLFPLQQRCCPSVLSSHWLLNSIGSYTIYIYIQSAYPNARLEEKVYIMPPYGVLEPNKQGKVCKLKTALSKQDMNGIKCLPVFFSMWAICDSISVALYSIIKLPAPILLLL